MPKNKKIKLEKPQKNNGIFFSGPATKRGGEVRAWPQRKKKNCCVREAAKK